MSGAAQAASTTFGFTRISNNNVEDVASQLSLTVYDDVGANAVFGPTVALNPGQILVTFQNAVGTTSNITEVYVDDNVPVINPPIDQVFNSLGGFTDFSAAPPLNPTNLPEGNNIGFFADTTLSADTAPGNPNKGINEAVDILGISYNLVNGGTYQDVIAGINSGDLRFGLHVRSIGSGLGSDSFVTSNNGTVPEPLTILGAGAAVGFGASFKRKLAKSQEKADKKG
ncbi:MAG TPA: hypothetical protein DCF68_02920 [Cyanothece sp. UBA12306]|nr:hypothetical protein [Cyanothece sp. UBA12306]